MENLTLYNAARMYEYFKFDAEVKLFKIYYADLPDEDFWTLYNEQLEKDTIYLQYLEHIKDKTDDEIKDYCFKTFEQKIEI
jgi:hypothetical protein